MKTIYKVLYPVGFEAQEVNDTYSVVLPFVDEQPLEGLANEQSQFFNFEESKWEEAVTQDYSKKLSLLLAQINSKTMLTSLQNTKEIDAIKEQIGGAE